MESEKPGFVCLLLAKQRFGVFSDNYVNQDLSESEMSLWRFSLRFRDSGQSYVTEIEFRISFDAKSGVVRMQITKNVLQN